MDQTEFGARLKALPRVDKSAFLKTFVDDQRSFAKTYCSQGKRYSATWDEGGGQDLDASPITRMTSLDLDLGATTPVLKPRNPNAILGLMKSRDRDGEKAIKLQASNPPAGIPSRNTRESITAPPPRSKQDEAVIDGNITDNQDGSEQELAKRLETRRGKRKARRDIVRPCEKSLPRSEEKEQEEEVTEKPTKRKDKAKVPAGLALMHGFRATNVGRSRLTMERTVVPLGVFLKGKASAKATLTKLKQPKNVFSEMAFLGKSKREKCSPARADTSSGPSTTSSRPRKKRKRWSDLEVEPKQPSPVHEQEESHKESAPQARSQSVVWDIERDSATLPSTVDSVPFIRPKVDESTYGCSEMPGSCPVDYQALPVESFSGLKEVDSSNTSSRCSLGPFDSVSHALALPAVTLPTLAGSDPVISRFFRKQSAGAIQIGTCAGGPGTAVAMASASPADGPTSQVAYASAGPHQNEETSRLRDSEVFPESAGGPWLDTGSANSVHGYSPRQSRGNSPSTILISDYHHQHPLVDLNYVISVDHHRTLGSCSNDGMDFRWTFEPSEEWQSAFANDVPFTEGPLAGTYPEPTCAGWGDFAEGEDNGMTPDDPFIGPHTWETHSGIMDQGPLSWADQASPTGGSLCEHIEPISQSSVAGYQIEDSHSHRAPRSVGSNNAEYLVTDIEGDINDSECGDSWPTPETMPQFHSILQLQRPSLGLQGGNTTTRRVPLSDGFSRAEIDVAKNIRGHWYPQKL